MKRNGFKIAVEQPITLMYPNQFDGTQLKRGKQYINYLTRQKLLERGKDAIGPVYRTR